MIKRLFFFLVFLSCFISGNAQTFTELLSKAYRSLENLKNVSYEVVYRSFGESEIISDVNMKIEIINGTIYTQIDKIETYSLDSTQIIIDHQEKTILLNTGLQKGLNQGGVISQLQMIDQLEKKAEKIDIMEKGASKKVTLYFSNEEFVKVELEFDSNSGLFKSVKLFPKNPIENVVETEEPPVVQYEIKIANLNQKISQLTTPLSSYLEVKDGRYILKSKYSSYRYENNYDWH